MMQKARWFFPGFLTFLFILNSCSRPLEWPESPLYVFEQGVPDTTQPAGLEGALEKIVGHYAHYDVVAYEDTTTRTTMRTFIISYGFTDFYLKEGRLMQSDRFVHAEQKLSRKNAGSVFNDEAVQAIKPRVQEVELFRKEGAWHIFRPENPSLLGIEGDPMKPLSTDPHDPNLTDPDKGLNPVLLVKVDPAIDTFGELMQIRGDIFPEEPEFYPKKK